MTLTFDFITVNPLTYFCVAYFLLFGIYQRATFEAYSLIGFRVIHSGLQVLNIAT